MDIVAFVLASLYGLFFLLTESVDILISDKNTIKCGLQSYFLFLPQIPKFHLSWNLAAVSWLISHGVYCWDSVCCYQHCGCASYALESQRCCWPSHCHCWDPCGSAREGCLWKQFASRHGMQQPLESALFKNNPAPAPMPKSSRLQHRLIQMRFMIRRKEDLSSQTPTWYGL